MVYIKNHLKDRVKFVKSNRESSYIWIKLLGEIEKYICFCYSCPSGDSAFFFQKLSHDTLFFKNSGEILFTGDFNARLGDFVAENAAKPDFLSFLKFHSLSLMNKIFAHGASYHHVLSNFRSIIDFCLSFNPESVENFSVGSEILGSSRHASHKIIECTLLLGNPPKSDPPPHSNAKPPFNHLSEDNSAHFSEKLAETMISLLPFLDDTLAQGLPTVNPKSVANAVFRKFLKTPHSVAHPR